MLIFLPVNILSNTLQTMKQMENKMQVHNDCVSLCDSNTLQTMTQMEYKMHISLNWTLREVGEYYTLSYKT